jgi:hypothetical protein
LDDFLELGFIALQQVVDPFCDPNIFTEGIVTGISLVLNVIVLPLYIFFCLPLYLYRTATDSYGRRATSSIRIA